MKILTRYILKEMVGPTLLGLAFYTSIILMRQIFELAALIIRKSLSAAEIGRLLLLTVPNVIVLTLPMALLFGILIAIGRLSADSEIIAMRALGISTRTIYRPVFIFSVLLFLVNLYLMNSVLPKGNTMLQVFQAEILTTAVQKEVKPRVFHDEYDNLMIYIDRVDLSGANWNGVFVADSRGSGDLGSTPQDAADQAARNQERVGGIGDGSGQRIVTAEHGNLSILKESKQIWLDLRKAETHVWNPARPDRYDLNRNETQRMLLPRADRIESELPSRVIQRSLKSMTLSELIRKADETRGKDDYIYNLARVEIQKKFAIPFACLAFGILALPLGITNRRGGKSSGFSVSIAVIVFYYIAITNGEQMAATGRVSPVVGMWTANIVLAAMGVYLMMRANREIGSQRDGGSWFKRLFEKKKDQGDVVADDDTESTSLLNRFDVTFPNIIDRYILREFLKVLALVIISVVALFVVIDYTDIAKDVRTNHIAFHTVFAYYRFLVFQIINWALPISVLVATLVAFGIMSKNNEITAIKSGGVSLYRVALPVVVIGLVMSVLAYFILDFVLPYANERSAALKRKIEGRPPISASGGQRLWFLGKDRYIINFLAYDRNQKVLSQVQVFEFHPTEFRITRRVWAQRARWSGKAWVFENGWIRSFQDDGTSTFSPISAPLALHYSETPEQFATEARSADQMTFAQLRRYVATIRESGYPAEDLAVKLYAKTSWPAITFIMTLLALPFSFRMGKKGALYGIGISLMLGITYWMIFAVFTKFGEVGNLPPLLSAWSANILFGIAAIYMFLHVET
jgi:LPS export ABC transporter permease LptG/LPS export ABC transporter permease LptF